MTSGSQSSRSPTTAAPPNFGVSILELRDGRIARESIYVTEAFEAPEWRAQWRAAP